MFDEKGFQPIGTIIENWDRGDGPRDGFYTEDEANGVFFLRINNLKEHSINVSNVKFINREVHENTLRRSQVSSGDVIFAISGTKDNLGTVSIVPDFIKEANLNSALVRLSLDANKINNEYFCWLFDLDFVRTQIDFIGKGAAQNNLNNKEISQIQIPLFDIKTQENIGEKLKQAHAAKRAKEAEARALLESIDSYVLAELGITLPEEQREMMFRVPFSRVRGGRFDPCAYHPIRKQILENLEAHYPLFSLKQMVKFRKIALSDNPDNLPYVGLENIESNTGRLIPSSEEKTSFGTALRFEAGDILFPKLRPYLNKVYLAEKTGACSTEFYVLQSNKIQSSFLFCFLSCQVIVKQTSLLMTGNTLPRLQSKDMTNLLIPLPPLDVQERIAREVQVRRERAKALEREAAELLVAAKAEVERMILG